jgi:effector-binding domain-containing protein
MEAFEVRIVDTDETPTAVVRATSSWAEYPALWPRLLERVWSVVRERGVPAGRNVMRYLDDVPHVEVGVELEGPCDDLGELERSWLPGGRAATTVIVGQLTAERIALAHAAIHRYSRSNGITLTGQRWEIYGHQRGDPAAIETAVYWPVS